MADQLKAALNEASAELDLTTTLSEISTDELKSKEIRPFSVTVYGADHPGIVSGISERIATLEASIVDMTTRVLHSAGGTTYVMVLEVDPPADLTLETIAAELAEQAEALGVSVRVHQAGDELL
ncbi:glycine cleavage system transcriptional repressor [mine drainage metagenome]|uniref:Glycine cleavage system transcriptional repressor n=1 Tax=mine drainage metagenome TaxID=410659 RepID=T0ZVI4_9ZZZZ